MHSYIPIFLMIGVGFFLGVTFLVLHRVLGPHRPNPEKLSTYESGMPPISNARERFSVKYYMVAVLFILFDIEVVFMYPWAVNFRALGLFGYVEMVLFILILVVGYIYIWKKGALRWD